MQYKDKESSYLMYFMQIIHIIRWAMSQRLPVNRFEWEKYTSKFNEKFIKSYDENTDIRYILEEDVEYP